ncbi:MAG: presenilin family intramembrane aspartyl protease [Candidatus Diapherotrites archaeon]
MNPELLKGFIILFFVSQALGLLVAHTLIGENVQAQPLVNDNPEDPINAVGLVAYILVFTAILLVFIHYFKAKHSYWLLKAIESVAIFGACAFLFSLYLNEWIALLLAVAIFAARFVWRENIWLRNLAALIAVTVAGSLLGVSLGIIPVIVVVALLAVYDLIAVFKTKHMVTLAKAVTSKNLAFTFAIPTKEHQFELGGGDLVIPLLFSAAALKTSTLASPYVYVPALAVVLGSLIGLIVTVNIASKKVGRALPALPLQALLMVIFFGIAKLAGF